MHPSRQYQEPDREQALQFIAAHPFSTLVVNGDDGPVTALAPMTYDIDNHVIMGHVARANPFWGAATYSPKAVAVFHGPDAYVSPALYPSKTTHGRVVPTWNYMAVEVRGPVDIETNSEHMRRFLEPLTNLMESHRAVPWDISDAPQDFIEKLSNGIVGVTIGVEAINYVKKLSQDKSENDKLGVLNAFEASGDDTERRLADAMRMTLI